MAVDAFPFFLGFGAADERGGGSDADSAGSIFDRLVRRVAEDSVASGPADGCSGLASRADAFRFLDEDLGGGGAGVSGACWLGSEVDEPAESLAAERVTLEDMRMRLNRWGHGGANVHQEGCISVIVESGSVEIDGRFRVIGARSGGRMLGAFC